METPHLPSIPKLPPYAAIFGLGAAGLVVAFVAIKNRSTAAEAPQEYTDAPAVSPDQGSGGSYYSSPALADPTATANANAAAEVSKQTALAALSLDVADKSETLRQKGRSFDFGLDDTTARRDHQFDLEDQAYGAKYEADADNREFSQQVGLETMRFQNNDTADQREFSQNFALNNQQNDFSTAADWRSATITERAAESDFGRSQEGADNDLYRSAKGALLGGLSAAQTTLDANIKTAEQLRGSIPGYESKKTGFLGSKTVTNKSDIEAARNKADAADQAVIKQRAAVEAAAATLRGDLGLTNTVKAKQGKRAPALSVR